MKWPRKRDPIEAVVTPAVQVHSDPLGRTPSSASLHFTKDFFAAEHSNLQTLIDEALTEQAERENELVEQGWLLMLTQDESLGDDRMGLLVETRVIDSGEIDDYSVQFETSVHLSPEVPFGQVDHRTTTAHRED